MKTALTTCLVLVLLITTIILINHGGEKLMSAVGVTMNRHESVMIGLNMIVLRMLQNCSFCFQTISVAFDFCIEWLIYNYDYHFKL